MRKALLTGMGFVSLAVGILGIFLPILPTTVFLLLSAWCWLRSSERFYRWLTTNRILGSYITNYRIEKGMTSGQKAFTIALLWLGISFTGIFVVSKMWLSLVLFGIAIGVTIHLLTLKTLSGKRHS